jgi:hypothetical protein
MPGTDQGGYTGFTRSLKEFALRICYPTLFPRHLCLNQQVRSSRLRRPPQKPNKFNVLTKQPAVSRGEENFGRVGRAELRLEGRTAFPESVLATLWSESVCKEAPPKRGSSAFVGQDPNLEHLETIVPIDTNRAPFHCDRANDAPLQRFRPGSWRSKHQLRPCPEARNRLD